MRLGVTPSLPGTSLEPATHFCDFMKADSNKDVTCTLLAIEIMGLSKLPSAKAAANAAALTAVQTLEGKTGQSLAQVAAASQAVDQVAGSAAAASDETLKEKVDETTTKEEHSKDLDDAIPKPEGMQSVTGLADVSAMGIAAESARADALHAKEATAAASDAASAVIAPPLAAATPPATMTATPVPKVPAPAPPTPKQPAAAVTPSTSSKRSKKN